MSIRLAHHAATTADVQLDAVARQHPGLEPIVKVIRANLALALGHLDLVLDADDRRRTAGGGEVVLEDSLAVEAIDALATGAVAAVAARPCGGCPACARLRRAIEGVKAQVRAIHVARLSEQFAAAAVAAPEPSRPAAGPNDGAGAAASCVRCGRGGAWSLGLCARCVGAEA